MARGIMGIGAWSDRVLSHLGDGVPRDWANSSAGLEKLRELHGRRFPPKRAAALMNGLAWDDLRREESRRRHSERSCVELGEWTQVLCGCGWGLLKVRERHVPERCPVCGTPIGEGA